MIDTTVSGTGTSPCSTDGICSVFATLPQWLPGGRYNVYETWNWNTPDGTNLTGIGYNNMFWINAPGIYLTNLNDTAPSLGEATSTYYNVTITNYGPAAGSGKVYMNENCSYISITAEGGSGTLNGSVVCSLLGGSSQNYYTVTSIPGNGTICYVLFKITAANISTGQTCSLAASTGDVNITTDMLSFNNITGISVSISNTDGTAGGTGTGTGTTLPSYTYNRSVKITSYTSAFSAKAGENISATVTVKNTGNTTSIVWLTATTNNSGITTAVGPTFASLAPAVTGTYTVYMNVSNSSRLGLAAGTFKAYVEGYTDTWYDTKPFDFTVLSTPEREAELNLSFANYTAQFANLTAIFNAIKASGLADIGNLTKVGEMFNITSDIVRMINEAINASNYPLAESLIIDLAGRLARMQDELASLQASKAVGEQKFLGDLYIWVVIGLVIAGAAGVVIYMLMPPKHGFKRIRGLRPGKKPEKGGKESDLEKIKQHILRKGKGSAAASAKRPDAGIADYAEMNKGKLEYLTAKYAEGYERSLAGRSGVSGRIKSVFKRKEQKKLKTFLKK